VAGGCAVVTASSGVGIIELADICATFRARSLDLFELTGGWVRDTEDPARQRWFAEASHRHAWQAELWAERSPSIPPVDADVLVAAHRVPTAPTAEPARTDRYLASLDALLGELDGLEARLVPELDPSTLRTVARVRADLVGLRTAGAPPDGTDSTGR